MKRKLIAALIAAAILILGGIIGWETGLLYRVYPFSHEVCTVYLTVDGTPYPIHAEDVTGGATNTDINEVKSVKTTDDGGVIRMKGLVYGNQPFTLRVQTPEMETALDLPISVVVPNWWEITKIELHLSIDTKAGSYSCTGDYSMFRQSQKFSLEGQIGDRQTLRISGI